jgi:hypothetical protein
MENKMELKLTFSIDEANQLLSVLGDMPSKTGVWPLIVKIKEQAEAQLAKKHETEKE